MTTQYHLTIQELNLELLQTLQKAFGGKKVAIEIKIQTLEPGQEEDFAEWRRQFLQDSARQLNGIYSPDEPEYSEADLQAINPSFKPV